MGQRLGSGTTDRRTVVRGALWATPAVVVATSAPAAAASCGNGTCPNAAFGAPSGSSGANGMTGNGSTTGRPAAGNGWTAATNVGSWANSGTNNAVGFQTGGTQTQFASTNEPQGGSGPFQVTLTQTGQPALSSGCTYTIRLGIIYYKDPPSSGVKDQTVSVLVGGTVVGSWTTSGKDTTTGYRDVGLVSFSATGVSGTLSIRFDFTASGPANDITVYSPSVVCA